MSVPKSHLGRNIGIVATAVMLALVVLEVKYGGEMVTVTSVNVQIVYPNGATNGPLVVGATEAFSEFEGGQSPETILIRSPASANATYTIDSITTSTQGFAIDSISPILPHALEPGSGVQETVMLALPNLSFNGALTLVITVS
jgi:hypothetical protein